jgi:hypothetical protein
MSRTNKEVVMDLRTLVIKRLKRKRKELEHFHSKKDYYNCIWLDGQIFALENILCDIPTGFYPEPKQPEKH